MSNGMLAILLTGVFVFALIATGTLKINTASTTNTNPLQNGVYCINGVAVPSGFQCGASMTLTASLQDPLLGSGINSATVTINNGPTQVDSITTGAAGTGTSAASTYTTGQQFWAKISATNYVTEEIPVIVPPVPVSASPATTVTVPLYDVKTGTYSFTMVATGGTTISTAQVYIWASTGLTSLSLTTTITETVNNNGYKSTWDFINNIMNDIVLEISDGGGASSNSQYMTINGPEYTTKVGTTNYWISALPDGIAPQVTGAGQLAYPTDGLGRYAITGAAVSSTTTTGPLGSITGSMTQQLVGTGTLGGSVVQQFTIGKGNLATGNSITMSFKIWTNYDPNYFMKTGVGNPTSGQPTQLGSTFTIVFKG